MTEFFKLQTATERVCELLSQPVPLNQPADELEAAQYEARDMPVQLEMFASGLLMAM